MGIHDWYMGVSGRHGNPCLEWEEAVPLCEPGWFRSVSYWGESFDTYDFQLISWHQWLTETESPATTSPSPWHEYGTCTASALNKTTQVIVPTCWKKPKTQSCASSQSEFPNRWMQVHCPEGRCQAREGWSSHYPHAPNVSRTWRWQPKECRYACITRFRRRTLASSVPWIEW